MAARQSGFTLIELLVVIAIIGILAAMLFPVFAKAREKGRQVVCMSNLRQIGMSSQMYVQDHTERLPARIDGTPYTKSDQIFVCPSARYSTGPDAPTAQLDTSYADNGAIVGRSIVSFPYPDMLIYLQEDLYRTNTAYLRPEPTAGGFTRWHELDNGRERFSSIHFEGGNLLFCDGHVKWRKGAALRSGDFGLIPDNHTWSNPPDTIYTAAF